MSTNTDKAFNPGLTKPRVRAVFKGWRGGLMEYKQVTMTGRHVGTVRLLPDGQLGYYVLCSLPDKDCLH